MRKTCTIPDCGREASSRDYCRVHYYRFKTTGDPLKTKIASIPRGAPRSICSVDGCELIVASRGLCSLHRQRLRATGDPLKTLKAPKGEGLKYRDGKPYYVWLWEQHNGPVPKGFHVHHKDSDHSHDVIENLEARPGAGKDISHASVHLAKRNRETKKHFACFVAECPNVKGLCEAPDGHAYCPTHRQQIKVHGQITSRIPLTNSERSRAAWETKREKLSSDKPDGYLKHKRNSMNRT